MPMTDWPASEVAAEIEDCNEHIPFLVANLATAEQALVDQLARSADVYGADDRHWPASATTHIDAMRSDIAETADALAGARSYLAELRSL